MIVHIRTKNVKKEVKTVNTKVDFSIFCANVRKLREKHNLTKKEMANKLNISTYMLEQIEKGIVSRRVSPLLLVSIYQSFGVSCQDIIYTNIK